MKEFVENTVKRVIDGGISIKQAFDIVNAESKDRYLADPTLDWSVEDYVDMNSYGVYYLLTKAGFDNDTVLEHKRGK